MKVVFNHKTLDKELIKASEFDRAIRYGDGFFETMRVVNGRVPLLEFHLDRLRRAMHAAGLEDWHEINDKILGHVQSLVVQFPKSKHHRARLIVWRKAGGLYTPESDQSNFLLEVQESHQSAIAYKEQCGVATSMYNVMHPLSSFKRLSAMQYVMAAREMKAGGFDDIIICDQQGNISECLYSNIFWRFDNVLYTASLKSGCIDGTMRRFLLQRFQHVGVECQEVLAIPEVLQQAEVVFASNAMGISFIGKIKNAQYVDWPQMSEFLPF
ncbi:MAG: aminotransferase class IV [Cyclobacteriaceae bacterium]